MCTLSSSCRAKRTTQKKSRSNTEWNQQKIKTKKNHEEEESIKETKQNPRRKTKNTNDIYIDTPQRPLLPSTLSSLSHILVSHLSRSSCSFRLLFSPLPCHVALSALCKCCPICQLAQICISVAQPSGRMTYGCPLSSSRAPSPSLLWFSVHFLFLLLLSNTFPTLGPESHRTWPPCQRLISRSKKFSLKLAVKCHQ